ncbi:uncharacterized protein LOC119983895 [Tripterygium wilfordii]|uniref:uncharacterized protein LOC119983895 n=1 Tax=Tripterygium wilfordii TaxID=458696 RepID=UPI0018F7EBCC|nr:uncharacterized protein LOC119983895 [Tripterygium wilfordii]
MRAKAKEGRKEKMMEMKKVMVAVLIVCTISSNLETAEASVYDCMDACTTACVQPNTRLMQRCERKCDIRCNQDLKTEEPAV